MVEIKIAEETKKHITTVVDTNDNIVGIYNAREKEAVYKASLESGIPVSKLCTLVEDKPLLRHTWLCINGSIKQSATISISIMQ